MADNNLPAKRKHTLNSKLTSEDNVHRDTVKRQQLEGMQSSANTLATANHSSRQASVEAIDDKEDHVHHNASPPKNPKSILEGTDDKSDEDSGLQEETDEQELSKATIHTLFDRSSHLSSTPPKGLAIPGLCLLLP
jgi:hypothetical protein